MKKLFILVLIAAAAYWGYKHYGSNLFGSGAFDDQGKPKVLLFTMEGCGQLCADVAADLRSRNVTFEEVDIGTDAGRSRIQKFGAMAVPLTVIGNKKVIGNDLPGIEAALAEAQGMEALTPAVQEVMRKHFDERGKPRVVLYGTETCPYCKRIRAYMDSHKIAYQFMDVAGDSSARRDFDILRGGGFPLIYVGYRRIPGYEEGKLNQAVKELL